MRITKKMKDKAVIKTRDTNIYNQRAVDCIHFENHAVDWGYCSRNYKNEEILSCCVLEEVKCLHF